MSIDQRNDSPWEARIAELCVMITGKPPLTFKTNEDFRRELEAPDFQDNKINAYFRILSDAMKANEKLIESQANRIASQERLIGDCSKFIESLKMACPGSSEKEDVAQ